ncbi:GNAT family N-acetyltransferase [Trabulsiella odontotermitis]|uniref:GNAT family N-acetyltransferase n=1 Tax=Trabulsiella odontotermitis TaxID=379893 RepID=UPI0006764A37|nr:GNAT family N-acetyltransferase [Trabulsiella odontotermitis]
MVSIEVSKNAASQQYLQIVWDTFFKQKSRGVSLQAHFPWLYNSSNNFFTLEIKRSGITAGGLVLAEKIFGNLKIGLVGLVCIDDKYRGQGLFGKIMHELNHVSVSEGFSALYLWSSQQYLYKKYGFESFDDNLLAEVKLKTDIKLTCSERKKQIIERPDLPIPPFADAVYQFDSNNVSILYCTNSNNKFVISFKGAIKDVVLQFGFFCKNTFYINLKNTDKDKITKAMEFAYIDIAQQNIQMIKFFEVKKIDQIKHIHFLLNERI